MAPSKDKWIRRLLITETSRHKKGFTVYKVTSVIYPKSAPEAVSRVSIWKRYNDFRQLYRELSSRHESLKIKEAFPPFPKPKFFGRFEAEVIEERRQCAIRLLEFIAKHTPLFTSNVFVKFFESGHSCDYLTDCSLSISSDTSEDDQNLNSALRGTNYHPTPVCNTQSPKLKNRTITDFHSDDNVTEKSGNFNINSCTVSSTAGSLVQNLSVNNNYIEESDFSKERAIDIIKTECIDNEIDGERCERKFSAFDQNFCPEFRTYDPESNDTLVHDGSDLPDRVDGGSSNYILVAAAQMSAAFRHEAICEYEEAFTQYKLGISNLLNGVQSDPDHGHRKTIKKKISKYLERAEMLYNRHLNCNISVLSKPVTELQNYKVLRIMGSVMLVRDISWDCNRVIKTVQKPAGNVESLSDYILCGKIPFMVCLYGCIQTETTIFLVLQYASGGKLWEYIKSYHKGENIVSNLCEKSHTRSASCDAIIQSTRGKKTIGFGSRSSIVKENNKNMKNRACEKINLDMVEKVSINPDESLKKLEEDLRANSTCNKSLPTMDLLAKAQALLQSVDATIKKSNSIASRLNESKTLLYSQSKQDYSENLTFVDNLEVQNTKEESKIDQNNSLTIPQDVRMVDETQQEQNTKKIDEHKEQDEVAANPKFNINKIYSNNCFENLSTIPCSSNISESSLSKSNSPKSLSKFNGFCRKNEDLLKSDQFQIFVNEDSGIEMDDELWKLPEGTIRFWAAEILLSLESLHHQNVIVGDLKPDNILLGNGGHILMSYIVPRRNFEFLHLKKPYSAPELCMFVPTVLPSTAADVWSYGILLYELFTGVKFQAKHPGPFHSHSILNIPDELSPNAKSLISGVLQYQPVNRLTIPEIKKHPFFSQIDWASLVNSSFT